MGKLRDEKPIYVPLESVIGSEDLNVDMYYMDKELDILEPRLRKLGYTDISWHNGEVTQDGKPVTRVCVAKKNRKYVYLVYG